MYGLWILVIIFGSVGAVLVTLGCISHKLYMHYDYSLEYAYVYLVNNRGEHTTTTTFSGREFDKQKLSEEQYKRFSKRYRAMKFWSPIDDVREVLWFIGGVLLVLAFVIALFAIFIPIGSRQEVVYWENFVEMVDNTLEGASNYETAGIAGKIIEYNSWLTQARTSQEFYGNWSSYFGIDLSQLEYIKIEQ